jgi:hypothetical protein
MDPDEAELAQQSREPGPDGWCSHWNHEAAQVCMKPKGHDGDHWAIMSTMTWKDG